MTLKAVKGGPSLFTELNDAELSAALSYGRPIIFRKDDTVIREGEAAKGIYLATSGVFACRKSSPSGLLFALGKIKAQEFFGEAALVEGRPSEMEVVAACDASALIFGVSDFNGLMERHPSITLRMIEEMALRISRLETLSFELATMKLDDRLKRTIESLARESNQLHDGGVIRPAPTHAELASMLGTTREVISRSLTSLRRQGTIRTRRQEIHIRSVNSLNWRLAEGS